MFLWIWNLLDAGLAKSNIDSWNIDVGGGVCLWRIAVRVGLTRGGGTLDEFILWLSMGDGEL